MAREGRPTRAGPSPGLFRPVVGMTARPGAPRPLAGRWAAPTRGQVGGLKPLPQRPCGALRPVTDWDQGPIR